MIKTILVFIISFSGYHMVNAQDTNDTSEILVDGPYVFYEKGKSQAQYIFEKHGTKFVRTEVPAFNKKVTSIKVPTDIPGETFTVNLKSKLNEEKPEYPKVDKMLIVSDIEANFKAFRNLLQSNGVIDNEFNWTFGEGRVILLGDFFDRGSQQVEVLWLIYALEDKAKAAKGYVHFVLGNHEVMNMNGDLRYVHPKYYEHAKLLNRTYLSLYDQNTELGRWLRTKNIMEKVGNVLCMHGGVSSYVNMMALSLTQLNDMARPFYDDTTYRYPDPKVDILYSEYGPLWYRGYYVGKERATHSQVDSTLNLYNVDFIATGHTIVSNKVGCYFNGKVLNADVPHVKGFSEAILYEDKKFFRVNSAGERTELKLN